MRLSKTAFLFFLVLPCLSWGADLKNENLLQTLPPGYKIDFQTRQGNMIISEMVPQAESVNNWTEMITSQVFLGMKNITPEQFQTRMQQAWMSACKEGKVISLAKGEENGYPFAFWLQYCPLNQGTGKPEITWFKAIKGNNSFYVVQKAFKFEPSQKQVVQWSRYLRTVSVCDTRLPERACPKTDKASN